MITNYGCPLDEAALYELWESADLLPAAASWPRALKALDDGRDFDQGARWGIYNIQRLYLDFLEALEVREDTLPGEPVRRELVFYELGKFSQAISDFEQIYFSTSPYDKYTTFAKWLKHQAPDYYAESDSDVGYATPDAVTLSTVHQAKGTQWPAVFAPCMRRNRFPSKRQGGLNLLHIIPAGSVHDSDRYRGSMEDERRLFYVAATRAQKYFCVSFSPGASNLYGQRSEFFDDCTSSNWVLTRDPGVAADAERLTPQARHETPQVSLSFSELKYFFECPYQFKLRFLYGFNPPLHEALGYGKGVHDALAELHKRALAGDDISDVTAGELVDRHLLTPYAYPELRETLRRSAVESVARYMREHEEDLRNTLHSEKQIQVHIAPGITVDGRIDLVKRLETDEVSIVDFKSTDRAQAEDITRDQLHVYAVGYEELTGERADLIEVLNLDEEGKNLRELVEEPLVAGVRERIRLAGESLRTNDLPKHRTWCGSCDRCDLVALCRSRESSASSTA
jgi:DNA helicase-2/ATP-dependent DNA helicase PcrA